MQPEVEELFDLVVGENGVPERVLDVGCASGRTSVFMRSRGVKELVGIELDPRGVAIAREYMNRVIEADATTAEVGVPDGYFDLVLLTDILEHVYDPWAMLDKYVQLVKPGGFLLIVLPNAGHIAVAMGLLAGDFRYQDAGILDNGHIRFFTLRSANRMITDAGLETHTQRLRMDIDWQSASVSKTLGFFDNAIAVTFDDGKLPPGLRQTHFARKLNFLCRRPVDSDDAATL